MSAISSIVVPVDFSNAARNAMHYGAMLASKFTATLSAVHIIPSFTAFNYTFPGDVDEFEKKAFTEAKKRLPDEIPEAFRNKLRTRAIVKSGDVRDELLGVVKDENADLLVMGTHGRRGVERFFLGSTTENMLRKVAIPILTVSERGSSGRMESPFDPPFRRILYASDLSEASAAGLRYCADFARSLEARITMLYVMDVPQGTVFDGRTKARAQLLDRLNAAIAGSDCAGLDVKAEVGEGHAHTEILKCAERDSADLVVLNLQSHTVLERALLGSTAERVIRSASIPVLSIPVERAGTPAPAIAPEFGAARPV